MRIKKSGAFVATAMVAAVSAIAVPLVVADDQKAPATTHSPVVVGTQAAPAPANTASVPSVVSESLRSRFAAFRREAGPMDRLDAKLSQKLTVPSVKMNPALARSVGGTQGSKTRLYLVPAANEQICVVDQTGSGGCQPVESYVSSGSVSTDECPAHLGDDKLLIYGVVPDGVGEVTLRLSDGGTLEATVTANAWSVETGRGVQERPESVHWSFNGAEKTLAVPYSPDVAAPC